MSAEPSKVISQHFITGEYPEAVDDLRVMFREESQLVPAVCAILGYCATSTNFLPWAGADGYETFQEYQRHVSSFPGFTWRNAGEVGPYRSGDVNAMAKDAAGQYQEFGVDAAIVSKSVRALADAVRTQPQPSGDHVSLFTQVSIHHEVTGYGGSTVKVGLLSAPLRMSTKDGKAACTEQEYFVNRRFFDVNRAYLTGEAERLSQVMRRTPPKEWLAMCSAPLS
ncbi:hypothetical protein ACWGH5_39275 [Streptomyces sp. NPDC054864]